MKASAVQLAIDARADFMTVIGGAPLITGRAIHQAADPIAAAQAMRSEIARSWAGGYVRFSS